MDYLFDIALLTVSGCSAAYCWVLGQRLKALHNLRKGVGMAIVNLTKSVTAVEANATKLNREAQAAVLELRAMLGQVAACEGKVDDLLGTMDRQARETWKDYRKEAASAATQIAESTQALRVLMADAKVMCGMMNEQLIAIAEAGETERARLLKSAEDALHVQANLRQEFQQEVRSSVAVARRALDVPRETERANVAPVTVAASTEAPARAAVRSTVKVVAAAPTDTVAVPEAARAATPEPAPVTAAEVKTVDAPGVSASKAAAIKAFLAAKGVSAEEIAAAAMAKKLAPNRRTTTPAAAPRIAELARRLAAEKAPAADENRFDDDVASQRREQREGAAHFVERALRQGRS